MRRRSPLRVPVGTVVAGSVYRRGDRLRDLSGVVWIVIGSELAVGVEMVEIETAGGGMRRWVAAERLAEWERWT